MQMPEQKQVALCFTSWMTARGLARSWFLYQDYLSQGFDVEIFFLNIDRINFDLFNRQLAERNILASKVKILEASRVSLYEQIPVKFVGDFDLNHASTGSFIYLLSLIEPEKFVLFGNDGTEDKTRDDFYEFWFSKLGRRGEFRFSKKEFPVLEINPLWDLYSTYEDIWYWESVEFKRKK